jgi:NAD(P)-dependent dehydrogenase (short-subunit alcohol dehydrogenase family)
MKAQPKDDLEGKTVLVAGAGAGLGAAIARTAARAGARVVVNCRIDEARARAVADEIRREGGQATAARHDGTDYAQARELIEDATRAFGGVDVIVNTVGGFLWKPVAEMEPNEWRSTISSNLDSVYNLTHLALPRMRERRFGRIVCLASVGAERALGQSKVSAYLAAKSAVVAFCRSLALEEARSGITVNVVCPGLVNSSQPAGPDHHDLAERVPAGRAGSPEDVTRAVLFFASPSAGFVTGQVLAVAGGWLL